MSIEKRMKQHQEDISTYKPETAANVSGITRHAAECPVNDINWDNPTIYATFQNKNKRALQKDLFVRESLEIRHNESGPGKGLNDDYSSYVKTNAWAPLLKKI